MTWLRPLLFGVIGLVLLGVLLMSSWPNSSLHHRRRAVGVLRGRVTCCPEGQCRHHDQPIGVAGQLHYRCSGVRAPTPHLAVAAIEAAIAALLKIGDGTGWIAGPTPPAIAARSVSCSGQASATKRIAPIRGQLITFSSCRHSISSRNGAATISGRLNATVLHV